MATTPPAEAPIPCPEAPSRAPSPQFPPHLRDITIPLRFGKLFAGKAKNWRECEHEVDAVYSFINDNDFLKTLDEKQKSPDEFVHFVFTKDSQREIADPPRNGPNKGFDSDKLELLVDTAAEIAKRLRNGETIYVGCRGGKNRSLTLAGIAHAMARAHTLTVGVPKIAPEIARFISKQDPKYMGELVRIANETVDLDTLCPAARADSDFDFLKRLLLERFNDFTKEARSTPRKSARDGKALAADGDGDNKSKKHKKLKESDKA